MTTSRMRANVTRPRAAWRALPFALCATLMVARDATAQAQTTPPPASNTVALKNWTRIEAWSFFEPQPGGGDPTYADAANRLQISFQRTARRYDFVAALQYVQFGGLPTHASGPGPLGTGALYFDHSGRRNSRQVYLRYLNARWKSAAPGLSVQVGRMGYTSGAEAPSGNAKIEAVKRQRVDSRMIGEFEWSLYQRAFDGARVDWDRPGWHVSGAALRPTQGGFEDKAGARINDIDVFAGTLTLRPGRLLPRTDVQVFAYHYADTRPVRARPDNSGVGASAVDVALTTAGVTLVGAYPTQGGEVDALVWVAGQRGAWYDQSHRASAFAAEVGYQWTAAAWRPWVRAGVGHASGDRDPADSSHDTFFQMLPTGRKYSLSATYSLMNLTDAFVQASLRPRAALGVRVDLHRVALASAADRWYAGSGATQGSGSLFGFAGRPSRGATSLGTVIEGSADYTFSRRWSLNWYAGFIRGGDVVRRTFANNRLVFAYVENVIQF